MYVDKEGHSYFMSIFNSLDEDERQKFLRALKKVGGEVMGVCWRKVTIEDYYRRDREHVDAKEIVTTEMMRKAFWAIWGIKYDSSSIE